MTLVAATHARYRIDQAIRYFAGLLARGAGGAGCWRAMDIDRLRRGGCPHDSLRVRPAKSKRSDLARRLTRRRAYAIRAERCLLSGTATPSAAAYPRRRSLCRRSRAPHLRCQQMHRLRRLRQQLSGARNPGIRCLPGNPHPEIPGPPLHLLRTLRDVCPEKAITMSQEFENGTNQIGDIAAAAGAFHEHLPALRALLQGSRRRWNSSR